MSRFAHRFCDGAFTGADADGRDGCCAWSTAVVGLVVCVRASRRELAGLVCGAQHNYQLRTGADQGNLTV
jgi:hypothetical protein